MAKVKVVITHEEYGEFEIGDVPPALFGDFLKENKTGWSLSDMGADWKQVKVEIEEL